MASRLFVWIAIVAFSVAIMGCGVKETTPANVTLEIQTPQVADPFLFRAIATISNPAEYEIELSGQFLEQLDWAIEMKKENDSLVSLIPKPAIPDAAVLSAPPIRIEPGKTYSQNIIRLKIDPSKVQPGKYQIRFHGEAIGITDGSPAIELLSDWHAIELLLGNLEPDIVLPELLPNTTP